MNYEDYNNGKAPEPGLVWSGSSWSYPTVGVDNGSTITVWPANDKQIPIELFGPPSASGYGEPVDGMWINVPKAVSAELQGALNKITAGLSVPQWDDFISAPFKKFKPPYDFPKADNMINPSILIMPAKLLSKTPMPANSPMPATVDLHSRIADDIVDGAQYLSVVGNKSTTPFKVPVRMAKANKARGDWYAGWQPAGLNFLELTVVTKPNNWTFDDVLGSPADLPLRSSGSTVGTMTHDMILWFPKGSNLEPIYVAFTTLMPTAQLNKRIEQQTAAQKKIDSQRLQDAAKSVVDFYQLATERAGAQAAKAAQELANTARGKTIRNADQAMAAFNRYKDVLNKKYNQADREAIAKALDATNMQTLANNLKRLSRGLGYTSKLFDVNSIIKDVRSALRTGDWKPFFVTVASIFAGQQATALTAVAFSALLTTPVGIVGYVFLLMAVNSFIGDTFTNELKKLAGV